MARPRKDELGRCEQMNLRLTIEEKTTLEERARACSVTATEYARRMIFGVPLTFRQECDPILIMELNKIGVNINQIAKVFNSGAIVPPAALTAALAELTVFLDRVQCLDEETA